MTTALEVQDKSVALNGLSFHYRDWPNPTGRPLLLLHGYTSHARTWDTFAAAMQPHFRVLALDQRGHGESGWADDYRPERMIEDVDAFVRELKLEGMALLGLSMGGRNAYGYTAQHPDAVERLVIVDIGPEIVPSGSDRIRAGVLLTDVFDDPEEAVQRARAANPRAPEAELRHRTLNNLKQRDDGRWTFRYDVALRAPDRPLPRPDPATAWAELRRITSPTLLVRGAESDILAPETAERMLREIPNCRMVEVPNAGHSIPLDNPQGFIAAVQPFLVS
jgi:pimeloyl-ACP methyl ester carboxylesterase